MKNVIFRRIGGRVIPITSGSAAKMAYKSNSSKVRGLKRLANIDEAFRAGAALETGGFSDAMIDHAIKVEKSVKKKVRFANVFSSISKRLGNK